MQTMKILSAFFLILSVSTLRADDWPQFRGPAGDARSSASNQVPTQFSQANAVWKTDLPGQGWSSPVFQGDHIWLTTALTSEADAETLAERKKGVQFANIKTAAGRVIFKAICLNAADGAIVHEIQLADVSDPDLINPLNSYASPTPAIHEGKVICHFGNYGTWCLNATTGKQIWKKQLVVDHSVGPGSSPIIAGNVVIIPCDGIDQQFVVGLNLETGDEVWRTPRPAKDTTNGEFCKAYSTALLINAGGRSQAVIPTAQWICSYDPTTGKELWKAQHGKGFSTTPMANYESGLVIFCTGYMKSEVVAIDPTLDGDLTEKLAWRSRQGGSTMPTAVTADGIVYSIADDGILTMLNAATGEMLDRQRIGGKFAASPLMVGNRLYLLSQEGVITVLEVEAATTKTLAKSTMDGGLMASPAIYKSDLIIRTSKSIARYSSQ